MTFNRAPGGFWPGPDLRGRNWMTGRIGGSNAGDLRGLRGEDKRQESYTVRKQSVIIKGLRSHVDIFGLELIIQQEARLIKRW